jgi:uncharacterized OB-fold protein
MNQTTPFCLPEGLPIPVPEADGLSAPFWEGLQQETLRMQRCGDCKTWQWEPEWICHHCLSLNMRWEAVEPEGRLYVVERVWHPVHPALREAGPYLLALVELPQAGGVRMIGNIVGDPMQQIAVGTPLRGVFEHHRAAQPAYTLLQWKVA